LKLPRSSKGTPPFRGCTFETAARSERYTPETGVYHENCPPIRKVHPRNGGVPFRCVGPCWARVCAIKKFVASSSVVLGSFFVSLNVTGQSRLRVLSFMRSMFNYDCSLLQPSRIGLHGKRFQFASGLEVHHFARICVRTYTAVIVLPASHLADVWVCDMGGNALPSQVEALAKSIRRRADTVVNMGNGWACSIGWFGQHLDWLRFSSYLGKR
jgi:hypothetical protein